MFFQEKRAGNLWGRRKGERCLVGGCVPWEQRRWGLPVGVPRSGRLVPMGSVLTGSALSCSKELKDPDQLYNTLKNLLAQIKVGSGGALRCHSPPPHPSPLGGKAG